MKISKLFLDKILYKGRCTGRSTGQALGYIGDAMQNPGVRIHVRDHWGTLNSDRSLTKMCMDIVRKLELKYFIFTDSTIMYNVLIDIEE